MSNNPWFYKPCCVLGCGDKVSSRHRFPNPEKEPARFSAWIDALATPKLWHINRMQLYNNFRVCRQHFSNEDLATNNRLQKIAVPSKNLPRGTITFILIDILH